MKEAVVECLFYVQSLRDPVEFADSLPSPRPMKDRNKLSLYEFNRCVAKRGIPLVFR
jgi:hypothetical protein